VPIGIIQLLLSIRYMRIEDIRSSSINLDWIGAVTFIVFIMSLMALLGQLSASFAYQPAVLALTLVFLGSLAAFVINESRNKSPLLDLSIFRNRMFVLPCISMILFFVANLMISILGPFYFEGVMGFGLLGNILVGIVGSIVGGAIFGGFFGTSGIGGWITSILGAIVLLIIAGFIKK
jgi:uncharacterized membrane protein YeaQ/YmgE (transglycosylase-associated protein family)